jgi:hypothetical protein
LKLPGFVTALLPKQPPHRGVMGVFSYADDAADALRALGATGARNVSVFSPVPFHVIDDVLKPGPSLVRWVCFAGGVAGITGGFSLCIYSVLTWPMVVAGKELVSLPPFVIIGYESMILLGGLFNLIGMLALARLPRIGGTAPYDERFTEDKIGVWVPAVGDAATRAGEVLRGHGADEVKVYG